MNTLIEFIYFWITHTSFYFILSFFSFTSQPLFKSLHHNVNLLQRKRKKLFHSLSIRCVRRKLHFSYTMSFFFLFPLWPDKINRRKWKSSMHVGFDGLIWNHYFSTLSTFQVITIHNLPRMWKKRWKQLKGCRTYFDIWHDIIPHLFFVCFIQRETNFRTVSPLLHRIEIVSNIQY